MENTPNHITGEENCRLLSYSDGEKLIIRHKTTSKKTLNYHKEELPPNSVLILRREGGTQSLCSVNTNVSRATLEHRPLLVNQGTHTVCFRRVNQTAAELYFFQTPTTERRPCLPITLTLM